MASFRHFFREVGDRLQSYLSPLKLFFKDSPSQPDLKNYTTKELDWNAGLEYQLENPDSLLQDKSKDLTFYDTMLQDDKIKSIIELKKRLVLSAEGEVIPASEDKIDMDVADFCKWNFENTVIPFNDLMDNYLDAQAFGFKVGELVWMNEQQMTDSGVIVPQEFKGKWYLGNIKHKHSIFFDFAYEIDGKLKEMYIGRNYGINTVVDAETIKRKFLIFVYPYAKDGNWYGDSDLKEVYMQWFAKFQIFKFRNVYLERYGMPIPEIVYDVSKTSADEKDELKKMMKNFQDSMYFIIPGAWNSEAKKLQGKFEIKLHEVRNGNATTQYEDAIDQIDKQISRKLLIPDKIGFAESAGGSYNMAEIQFNMFAKVIEDLQNKTASLVNNLIKKMVDLNFTNIKDYPTFKFGKVNPQLKEKMIEVLINTGIIDKREKWIRKYVGIPMIDDKEKEEIEAAKEEARNNAPPVPQFPPQNQFPPTDKKFKKKNKYGLPLEHFQKIKEHYNTYEDDFKAEYYKIYMDAIERLVKATKKIVDKGNEKDIGKLKIKKQDFKKLFQTFFAKMYFQGKVDAIKEIRPRLKKAQEGKNVKLSHMQIEAEWIDRTWLENMLNDLGPLGTLHPEDKAMLIEMGQRGFVVAGQTEGEMVKTVGNTIHNGLRNGETAKTIGMKVEAALTDRMKQYAATVVRTNASDYYNTGRMNTFTDPAVSKFIEAYQYVAVLDDRTTPFCEEHDGQIIQKNDPELSLINPPNHFNCRSMLITVFIGESDDINSPWYNYREEYGGWTNAGLTQKELEQTKGFYFKNALSAEEY